MAMAMAIYPTMAIAMAMAKVRDFFKSPIRVIELVARSRPLGGYRMLIHKEVQ